MGRRLVLAAAAALIAACAMPSGGDEVSALRADPVCHAHRSWFPQRAAEGVWDDCVRHLGAEWCRRCLLQ